MDVSQRLTQSLQTVTEELVALKKLCRQHRDLSCRNALLAWQPAAFSSELRWDTVEAGLFTTAYKWPVSSPQTTPAAVLKRRHCFSTRDSAGRTSIDLWLLTMFHYWKWCHIFGGWTLSQLYIACFHWSTSQMIIYISNFELYLTLYTSLMT